MSKSSLSSSASSQSELAQQSTPSSRRVSILSISTSSTSSSTLTGSTAVATRLLLQIEEAREALRLQGVETTASAVITSDGSGTVFRDGLGQRISVPRLCLELKKYSTDADLVQNVFLARSKPNLSNLFGIYSMSEDPQLYALVCSIFEVVLMHDLKKHAKLMVKQGFTAALMEYMKAGFMALPSLNFDQKGYMEMILRLLMPLASFDTKMPVLARLAGIMPLILTFTVNTIDDWNSKSLVNGLLDAIAIFAQNENNAKQLWESSLLPHIVAGFMFKSSVIEYAQAAKILLSSCKHAFAIEALMTHLNGYEMLALFKVVISQADAALPRFHAQIMTQLAEHEIYKKDFNKPAMMKELLDAYETMLNSQRKNEKTLEVMVNLLLTCFGGTQLPFSSIEDFKRHRIEFDNTDAYAYSLNWSPEKCLPERSMSLQSPPTAERTLFETFHNIRKCELLDVLPNRLFPDEIIEAASKQPPEAAIDPQVSTNDIKEANSRLWERLRDPTCLSPTLVYDVDQNGIVKMRNQETLEFESRFESGNLWKAIQVNSTEYDLILDTDINAPFGRHNQWFYFRVKNMQKDIPYRFNIINLSKLGGSFNQGMQPVCFSECLYQEQKTCWFRTGSAIAHFQNHFIKPSSGLNNDNSVERYGTLSFSVQFMKDNDTCYLSYHYPYTYSQLQRFLQQLVTDKANASMLRVQELCKTTSGTTCHLLTITNFAQTSTIPINERHYVLLTARIHPGESNSSWMMHGIIRALLSKEAHELRQRYIFKIVPMLNPDGVSHGSSRCSLMGIDLNRQWKKPIPTHHPTLYYTKALWTHITNQSPVLLSCDFHGHSRRKNVFFFGCESEIPLQPKDENAPQLLVRGVEKILPFLLEKFQREKDNSNAFDLSLAKFNIESSKEATARVVFFRELKIQYSYTCESSFFGADVGPLKKYQFTSKHLSSMGQYFCYTLLMFHETIDTLKKLTTLEEFVLFLEAVTDFKEILYAIDLTSNATQGNGSLTGTNRLTPKRKRKVPKRAKADITQADSIPPVQVVDNLESKANRLSLS